MALERIYVNGDNDYVVRDPSEIERSDVYSLTMTSFSVCTYFGSRLTTEYHHPVTIRSSRVYCHITEATAQA